MAFGCISCFAVSNLILVITGVLSLPLYFSFFGSEAAARFSLLLCIHSVLMAAIPKVLVSSKFLSYKAFLHAHAGVLTIYANHPDGNFWHK